MAWQRRHQDSHYTVYRYWAEPIASIPDNQEIPPNSEKALPTAAWGEAHGLGSTQHLSPAVVGLRENLGGVTTPSEVFVMGGSRPVEMIHAETRPASYIVKVKTRPIHRVGHNGHAVGPVAGSPHTYNPRNINCGAFPRAWFCPYNCLDKENATRI